MYLERLYSVMGTPDITVVSYIIFPVAPKPKIGASEDDYRPLELFF